MIEQGISQQAERLGRRRARMLPVLAVVYMSQQFSYFSATHGERAVDHVKVGAWVVLSLILLLGVATKGFWLRPREVRDLIDDEGTRANRQAALGWGFVMAVASAIALYFLSMFEAIAVREAVHVIVSLGIAAAIVRFAMLERRAYRDA